MKKLVIGTTSNYNKKFNTAGLIVCIFFIFGSIYALMVGNASLIEFGLSLFLFSYLSYSFYNGRKEYDYLEIDSQTILFSSYYKKQKQHVEFKREDLAQVELDVIYNQDKIKWKWDNSYDYRTRHYRDISHEQIELYRKYNTITNKRITFLFQNR